MPSNSSASQGRARRALWVRADQPESGEERRELVRAAMASGAELVVVRPDDVQPARDLGCESLGVLLSRGQEPREDAKGIDVDPDPPGREGPVAAMVTISGGRDQERARELLASYGIIIVDCKDWRVIPLENLIAACQKAGCRIFADVSSREDAELALGALERGVDGLLLEARKAGEIEEVARILGHDLDSLPLVEAEVVSVQPAGTGDRACIDTCSILEPGEGMLIGSQADGLVLVHGETIQTEYVEARPFRVNAGAIHSYILHVDDKTRYLSDMKGGDPVLLVGADGRTRVVTTGRVKIETRPLALVDLRVEGRPIKAILQDAETIRLVAPGGATLSVKDLKKGDRVLAYVSGKARHFGMAIEERLIER